MKGRSAEKCSWNMSNNSFHTDAVKTFGSRASAGTREGSMKVGRGCPVKPALLLRCCLCFRISSVMGSIFGAGPVRLFSLLRPPVTGIGYVHSRLPASQDRQGVPTPLLTHLTLDRRQRAQAIEDRIRA